MVSSEKMHFRAFNREWKLREPFRPLGQGMHVDIDFKDSNFLIRLQRPAQEHRFCAN